MFKILFVAITMMTAATPSFASTLNEKYEECLSSNPGTSSGACDIYSRRLHAAEQQVDRLYQERKIWGAKAVNTCRDILSLSEGPTYLACLQKKSR